mmetsp:Transcript_21700/g.60306  ORF Transcript_21700/g.60306 Transcript_21700/m.60306 type:complete len:215 (-) Transcript_21700:105-749(-)
MPTIIRLSLLKRLHPILSNPFRGARSALPPMLSVPFFEPVSTVLRIASRSGLPVALFMWTTIIIIVVVGTPPVVLAPPGTPLFGVFFDLKVGLSQQVFFVCHGSIPIVGAGADADAETLSCSWFRASHGHGIFTNIIIIVVVVVVVVVVVIIAAIVPWSRRACHAVPDLPEGRRSRVTRHCLVYLFHDSPDDGVPALVHIASRFLESRRQPPQR